jgi:restriction system protein
MAIPSFPEMLRPILDLAGKETITRQSATASMAKAFGLTAEECDARIPSGSATYVRNRAGWAMTFLTKGRLIEKVAPRTYRITPAGRDFLAAHPTISERDLRTIPGWREAWKSTKKDDDSAEVDSGRTPLEQLDAAVTALNEDVKDRLLASILEQSPAFFEQLVLDVLLAMGYGGSREDAAEHLGRGGDEGIDGRINQDPLGLDQILVQAKRYAPENIINRQTIQAFVGSMMGQGVSKGIFITTSRFNDNAREFVQRGLNAKIVLIDGDELLTLMLRHRIGVRVERNVEVLALDQNYFAEEE